MQKLIFFLLAIIIHSSIYAINIENHIIGGFSAPIYFTKYDQIKIDSIVSNPIATAIKISYPHQLLKLANKVANGIKCKSKARIILTESNLQDTNLVKYRHDAVIVILFFNSN